MDKITRGCILLTSAQAQELEVLSNKFWQNVNYIDTTSLMPTILDKTAFKDGVSNLKQQMHNLIVEWKNKCKLTVCSYKTLQYVQWLLAGHSPATIFNTQVEGKKKRVIINKTESNLYFYCEDTVLSDELVGDTDMGYIVYSPYNALAVAKVRDYLRSIPKDVIDFGKACIAKYHFVPIWRLRIFKQFITEDLIDEMLENDRYVRDVYNDMQLTMGTIKDLTTIQF